MSSGAHLTRCSILVLMLGASPTALAQDGAPRIRAAILGDSLSTGAATHPALTFDTLDLWRVFNGETTLETGLAPPTRLWPSSREFFGSGDWVFRHVLQGLSRQYLDTEEYSWGYSLAQGLGVAPLELAIAAEDGARTETLPRHLDRLLDATEGVLPEQVYVFYSGNDLCGTSMGELTSEEHYEDALRRGLEYALRNGRAADGGSDVYVVGFLSILQLLHSEEILAKKVRAFGRETTCKELRDDGYRPKDKAYDPGLPPQAWYFAMMMPPNPQGFCPSLFGGPFETARDEVIGALANRIRGYRAAQKKVVEELNGRVAKAEPAPKVRFHYVESTAELIFGADDIAGDCFHLSAKGQERVARAVETYVKSSAAP